MKRWAKEIIIFAISGLAILAYAWNLKETSPNSDDAKLREIQTLASLIPVFPGFNAAGSNTKSGYTAVDLTKYFNSTAEYKDVKEYYSRVLEQDGWTLALEDSFETSESQSLTFQKGEFSISLSYTNSSSVYNYALDFVWQAHK